MVKPIRVGHPLINHLGKEITVSKSTIQALRERNLITRSEGRPRFKSQYYQLFLEMEMGANRTDYFKELGDDMSGPNSLRCTCEECVGKLYDELITRYSKAMQMSDNDMLIAQIKRSRKMKAAYA